MSIQIQHVWTEDGLRLQGVHYQGLDTCVLLVHGMSGNFLENYFGSILGEVLSAKGIGFIYSHNRGYNHVNDISTKDLTDKKVNGHKKNRCGVVYERFEDCLFDIEAWVNEVRNLGYQKIILAGHSLGCNKVIHYLFKKRPKDITGLILLSPPDMVANGKEAGKSKVYDDLLSEAKKNVSVGNPRKLLSKELWNWYILSSQTFVDLFEDFGPADNLPLMRNPEVFPELASVAVPVLAVMGEYDNIVVRSLKEDMDLLAEKSTSAPSFTKVFLSGANHCYEDKEEELASEVVKWIKFCKNNKGETNGE
jgi:pimeloyl-ACP methyl ester carboxylesterase